MTKIRDAVEEVLTTRSSTRDDDPMLYIEVARLLGKMGNEGDVYGLLSSVDYESVRRSRQRLQAKYPDLRGTTYEKRHKKAEEKRKEYSPTFMDKINMWWSNI